MLCGRFRIPCENSHGNQAHLLLCVTNLFLSHFEISVTIRLTESTTVLFTFCFLHFILLGIVLKFKPIRVGNRSCLKLTNLKAKKNPFLFLLFFLFFFFFFSNDTELEMSES